MSSLLSYNWSYHILPLIWFQAPYASLRGPLIRLRLDDNTCPRIVLDKLEKSGKYSPNLIAKLRRREGCEKNLWEGLPMILAAIVAGNTAGLSTTWLNSVSIGYFVFRALYIYAYLNVTSKRLSFLRSALWWASNFCSILTFIKAGRALNNKF